MKEALIIIGILVGIILFLIFTIDLLVYVIHHDLSIPEDNGVKLSFKKFLQFYYLNPSRYCVIYNRTKEWPKWIYESSSGTRIYFGFFDYIRFCHWERRHQEEREEELSNTKMAKYLAVVQEDINEIRRTSLENISKAVDLAKEIKSRF